ncbi:MAG: hypothetical protein JNJ52_02200 [Flavobacterium sp.]|nr:hypothetical protein [Flavobacterium sp.]
MKKITLILIAIAFWSCENHSTDDLVAVPKVENSSLTLKWNKAYPDDSIDKSIIGLKWALSFIGAELPVNEVGISYQNNLISIDLNELGLNSNTKEKLTVLHSKIIASEEYQTQQAVDLGRYIVLLIGASEHYYELVGTPSTLSELLGNYTLLPQKGYVNNSSVSLEHRIIEFSEQNGFDQVFLSKEVNPITGEIYEYETIELLPNGQLRFGIFDSNGNRKNNADPSHSNAGKPAKCMWCHESNINQLYTPQNDFPSYLTASELQNTLINYRESNRNLKLQLTNGVDFSQTQQHTLTELLYISFMEPSAERLSLEWNLSLSEVQNLLSGLPAHQYAEFPFLGNLYYRNDIENLAPFVGLTVSSSVREQSTIEVNHLD